jgi:hypothetical protein
MTDRIPRGKTIALSVLLSGFAALSPAIAMAQGTDEFGPYGIDDSTFETPQNAAVELRFGPYLPNIDDEFAGTGQTPFADHYGNDTRWLIGVEADWQLLKIPNFGTLGPGFGLGFTKLTGQGFLSDGTVADQETTLRIMPMYAVAVLRVDTISKTTPVPLAPYAKAGLGWAMWWTDDGLGVPRAQDGSRGEDTSWGFQWALGVSLLLDAFDRRAAANLDASSGVNNSYFFLEWYNSDLDGFGAGDHMQVGTNTWMAGITLEM